MNVGSSTRLHSEQLHELAGRLWDKLMATQIPPTERIVQIALNPKALIAALESVMPIADEQAKDAERWRKLCSLIDVEAKVGTFEIEYQIGHVGEYTNVSEPILDGAQLTERVDRAIASAKGDDNNG